MKKCSFNLSVFLKRLNRCRGFGIQSPTDFAFVNEVIYQRMPFSDYKDLEREYPKAGKFMRRICKTLFRISNYAQPCNYVISQNTDDMTKAYLQRACQKAKTMQTLYFDVTPKAFNEGDCIIISDIYGEGKDAWTKLSKERNTSHLIMFDMYYFGVAFVRQRRFSELHTVNFY